MHVGQLVTAPVGAQGGDVEHVGTLHDHGAGSLAEVDSVHDEQHVSSSSQQLLHQVDAADPDLEHAHPCRELEGQECLRDSGTDAVVGAQDVAEAGHEGVHGGTVGAVAQPERDVLVGRLTQYPVGRYPVQHATAQFHLGSVLLRAGDATSALGALTTARDVFALAGMRAEHAKATLQLGVALRTAGRGQEAAAAFAHAARELGALELTAEQAAASYNLGLVHQDAGDLPAAHADWVTARELFQIAGHPAQAAAAARDHGASLLTTGAVAAALMLLQQAVALAESAADELGVGATANALGLGYLATADHVSAVTALRRALAAFPRATRPADYAMVKANLALAHELAGDVERARLAAGQALAVRGAALPVRAQARELLDRLPGRPEQDLMGVLDTEEREQWVPVLREEMLRWLELPGEQTAASVSGFLAGLLSRPGASYDLAQAFLEVLLELPPAPYGVLVAAVVASCAGQPEPTAERQRAVLGSAMARFALPQWQRLAAALNAAALSAGQPDAWR